MNMILSFFLLLTSRLEILLDYIIRFLWAFVVIISIISFVTIIILFVFVLNKSIYSVEWGNSFLKLKLKRGESLQEKQNDD